jgi:hypothetical protein
MKEDCRLCCAQPCQCVRPRLGEAVLEEAVNPHAKKARPAVAAAHPEDERSRACREAERKRYAWLDENRHRFPLTAEGFRRAMDECPFKEPPYVIESNA